MIGLYVLALVHVNGTRPPFYMGNRHPFSRFRYTLISNWQSSDFRVWLITGTSSGLGRDLVRKAVDRGDRVIATARRLSRIEDLAAQYPNNVKVLQLDVTEPFKQLRSKAQEAVSLWNGIDVVVNNAGFGCAGVIEEGGTDALMETYKTNVFGAVNVTNAFLPYLREQRHGTIVFIGSRSGWRTNFVVRYYDMVLSRHESQYSSYREMVPLCFVLVTNLPKLILIIGFYGSSKAALHAIADALAEEVKPFGIKVYNIMPGGIRTQGINNMRWVRGETSSSQCSDFIKAISDYDEAIHTMTNHFQSTNGHETGDSQKVAKVIVDLVHCEGVATDRQPDVSLVLGSDAKRDIAKKCHGVLDLLDQWGDVAASTDLSE
ncbi:hypothetical protein Clacol_000016 [Clathrus columnatus]|uniref:Uncharacterized protein n=1 Tax=Clathrus columnatus TaxID=1419009 RepID=A0AAV4ZZL4_9AGAM|nr:hypothetical protein Clacol_000016 [Clathrus columnatus]